ncbi:ATP-binding protein [Chishuiella sp.]|uniref:AlbA family DNA-binding domain-containing protein n=1 Tax=Chishuiella sp. TaxID=1969467 RepID=UPI0028B013D3|nr:ATP-binding protein [Chishuiella sp.]
MKENWSLELINKYIDNKVEENLHLDYKASGSLQKNDKKTNELSKDISAFANSDGGTIIYGIKENQLNKHLPEEIDPIDRNEISKEWIEQKLQGNITPRIQNLLIIPITVNEPNEVIYVIEVPKSDTAHQANDRKYYKRFNFNSEPMYDYEIKDILNRNKFPKIDLEFRIVIENHEVNNTDNQIKTFVLPEHKLQKEIREDVNLYVYARNNGKILANYVNAYFIFNEKFLHENRDNEKDSELQYFSDNTVRDVLDIEFRGFNTQEKYGPSRYDPILPRQKFNLKRIRLNKDYLSSEYEIKWVVFADNSEPNKGIILLENIEIIHK